MTVSALDRQWLNRAVALGRLGHGTVHPNPEVGCVLTRNEALVGEGYHQMFGGPHAEVAALQEAGESAQGATAYVSLEPCNHHGKTPPCSLALVEAGVRRVVFGAPDPGAEEGGGADVLRRSGIEVVGPVFDADRARLENPVFFHWHDHKLPWVQVKLALSVDGRIAAAPGARTAISGSEAGRWVHRLRASTDAILVGSTTAVVDDPLLTVRGESATVRAPLRVVLDSSARLQTDARMFTEAGGDIHLFVNTEAPKDRCEALEGVGATVHRTPRDDSHSGLNLRAVLEALATLGVQSVLCEGGGAVASSFLTDAIAERLHLIVSPLTLGSLGVPAFTDDVQLDPAAWRSFDALRGSEGPRSLGRDALVSFRRAY